MKGRQKKTVILVIAAALVLAAGTRVYHYVKGRLYPESVAPMLTDYTLKEQTRILGDDIMRFLREREKDEPRIDFKNWKKWKEDYIKYTNETMELYRKNYSSRLQAIYQEYARRNMRVRKVDKLYAFSSTPSDIKELSFGLLVLAEKL